MYAKQRCDPCSMDSMNDRGVCIKPPFNLTGKSAMAFLASQPWQVLKSGYTAGGSEHSQMDITRGLVLSVAQAICRGILTRFNYFLSSFTYLVM